MSELIRMDHTGHTLLARWTADDAASVEAAQSVFAEQLQDGYLAVVTTGQRSAEQVRELPPDAAQVILRRPIVGG